MLNLQYSPAISFKMTENTVVAGTGKESWQSQNWKREEKDCYGSCASFLSWIENMCLNLFIKIQG